MAKKNWLDFLNRVTIKSLDLENLQYVTNTGTKFFFKTNRNAPNFRIVEIDLERSAEENWITLIPVRKIEALKLQLNLVSNDLKFDLIFNIVKFIQENPNNVLMYAICVDNDKIIADYTHDVKVNWQLI